MARQRSGTRAKGGEQAAGGNDLKIFGGERGAAEEGGPGEHDGGEDFFPSPEDAFLPGSAAGDGEVAPRGEAGLRGVEERRGIEDEAEDDAVGELEAGAVEVEGVEDEGDEAGGEDGAEGAAGPANPEGD